MLTKLDEEAQQYRATVAEKLKTMKQKERNRDKGICEIEAGPEKLTAGSACNCIIF